MTDSSLSSSISSSSSPRTENRISQRRTRMFPLKTVLQNFLNHVETLERQKKEEENTYEKEFQVQ